MTSHQMKIGAVVVAAALFASHCKQLFQWSAADEFRASLKCRMSVDEARTVATKLGADEVKPLPSREPTTTKYEVRGRNTRFYLAFDNEQLLTVQQARLYGTTGVQLSIEENLCNGATRGEFMLTVRAPADLGGANVVVDGEVINRLSNGPTPQASTGGVPDGKHQLRIEKAGYKPIVKQVTYRPRGYWLDDNEVTITVGAAEVIKVQPGQPSVAVR